MLLGESWSGGGGVNPGGVTVRVTFTNPVVTPGSLVSLTSTRKLKRVGSVRLLLGRARDEAASEKLTLRPSGTSPLSTVNQYGPPLASE